jgi:5-methylcytosine-specific restriction endonuclease McrA
MADLDAFLAPRRCMREPIPAIFEVAALLGQAADAHLAGDAALAEALIKAADLPEVRAWTNSLWGGAKDNPDQASFHRRRVVADGPPHVPKADRIPARMPNAAQQAVLIARDGRNCAFCGIPLIRAEVRRAFTRAYPDAAYWGRTTSTCHAAFQCLWLQFDHVLPHSRGGDNSLENFILTCAGCNYGRMSSTLAEVGLLDPRDRVIERTSWDGLERIFGATAGGRS